MGIQLEHSDMVTTLAKDGAVILASMTALDMHILHMVIGIAGEAGELLDAIAIPVDTDNVIEEMGDCEFYMEGFRQGFGITRDETLNELTDAHKHFQDFTYCKNRARSLSIAGTDLLDLVKKGMIYRKAIPIKQYIERLTEIEFHMSAIRQHYSFTYGQTLTHNINKLVKGDGKNKPRYEGGTYSDKAAQNRADKHTDEEYMELSYEQLILLRFMRDEPGSELSALCKLADCSWDEAFDMATNNLIDAGKERLLVNQYHPLINDYGLRTLTNAENNNTIT